ncbi:MAG: DUF378 domain-containing protein [bacterium]|nr:DUF378 domain-containing protein [bacterium]
MKTLDVISMVLLIIGALNWGIMGLFDFNVIAAIFGPLTILARIIYVLVGIAGVYEIFGLAAQRRRWATRQPVTQ